MSYNIGETITIRFDTPMTEDKEITGEVSLVAVGKMRIDTAGLDPNYVYHSDGSVDLESASGVKTSVGFGRNAEVVL